ncbi:MAG: ankyrin 2,3/unc44 [uncultured bacterium (gcode 4)]|uniref:Ankyrin 2,3/unc44 n=1 Tax=uncultured bacterium (gcode 4) TaxID=1234023 RepID=K2FGE3_9BACT|nr:MAG: ankyrin 2,3/unc44 [uncultured bacterium (gcode 4)]
MTNSYDDILGQLSRPVEDLAKEAWVASENIWVFVDDVLTNKSASLVEDTRLWALSAVDDAFKNFEFDFLTLDDIADKLCASWQVWFKKYWDLIRKTQFIDELSDWMPLLNYMVYHSASNGDTALLEEILAFWANPNIPFNDEMPLHVATQYSNLNVVELLVKYWADPTIRNGSWQSSLLLAKANSNPKWLTTMSLSTARWLVQIESTLKSSDIYVQKHETLINTLKSKGIGGIDLLLLISNDMDAEINWEPWIIHFWYKDEDVMKALIDCWADVNVRNPKSWWTPLMYAAHNWNVKIIKMLLDARADLRVQWKHGRTALDIANSQWIEEVKRIIRFATIDKKYFKELSDAWFSTNWNIVKMLEDINALDMNNNILLQILSCSDYPILLQKCIDYWGRLDYREDGGMSSLMLAARMGKKENVEILLNAWANPNLIVEWWIKHHYKHMKKPMQRDLMDAADFAEFSWHPSLAKLIRSSEKYSRGSLFAKFKEIIN